MIVFVYAYCWGNKWFGEPGTCFDPVFSHGVLMHTSIYKSFLLAVLFIFVLTFLSTDSVKGQQKISLLWRRHLKNITINRCILAL
jgi:hypothetical protein